MRYGLVGDHHFWFPGTNAREKETGVTGQIWSVEEMVWKKGRRVAGENHWRCSKGSPQLLRCDARYEAACWQLVSGAVWVGQHSP